MSVFRIFFSFVYQFCIRKNERAFYGKRARILSETNRRFTIQIRSVNENNIDRNITLKFEDL